MCKIYNHFYFKNKGLIGDPLQITLLLHIPLPLINSSDHISGRGVPDQMKTLEGKFNWLGVLWERGFCHENPQGTMTTLNPFYYHHYGITLVA